MAKYKESSRLKNKLYLGLLNGEFIDTLQYDDIEKALSNIDSTYSKNKQEAKALVVLLYYTGARPAEILDLKGQDIKKEKRYIEIKLMTLKQGRPRKISLAINKPFMRQTWQYLQKVFPNWYIFNNFRSRYTRMRQKKNGEIVQYNEISAKLRYYFKIWFTHIDIPPYFLRHNRFSIMAEKGATNEEIQIQKGARTLNSVEPYLHLSKKRSQKMSKYM